MLSLSKGWCEKKKKEKKVEDALIAFSLFLVLCSMFEYIYKIHTFKSKALLIGNDNPLSPII